MIKLKNVIFLNICYVLCIGAKIGGLFLQGYTFMYYTNNFLVPMFDNMNAISLALAIAIMFFIGFIFDLIHGDEIIKRNLLDRENNNSGLEKTPTERYQELKKTVAELAISATYEVLVPALYLGTAAIIRLF